VDHGASLFNISSTPAPRALQALQDGGWVEPWKGAIALINEAAELLPRDGADPLFQGRYFQGRPGMEQLCEGLLHQARGLHTGFETLVRDVARDRDQWVLKDSEGVPIAEAESLVLTGTLLAHPRSRLTFGWPNPPLQLLAEQLQDPLLNHAMAAIASLRFAARSSLLLRIPAGESEAWLALPFRLLTFTPSAQLRWGLWRVSIQPLLDGSCAVVAHSSATFAEEHIGIYGSRSAMARQLGLTPSPEQEQQVIADLGASLSDVLTSWLPRGASSAVDRQLMRWGAAFPLAPGLPPELQWNAELNLGFCGDFIAGPGFGRVEGAMRSAETLGAQLVGLAR
jgi:predicted NAD/FAD-dependent oxidoreductase